MFSLKKSKSKLRQGNLRRFDPLVDQVKKVITDTDQQLILMVRG